jgi:hypothetical protein
VDDLEAEEIMDSYRDTIGETIEAERARAARVSFFTVFGEPADKFAEANKIARAAGVPASAVLDYPDEFKKEGALGKIDFDSLAKFAPTTAAVISDLEKAKAHYDDIESMGAIEGAVRDIGRGVVGIPRAVAGGLLTEGNVAALALYSNTARALGANTAADFFQRGMESVREFGDVIQGDYGQGGTIESGIASGARSFGAMVPLTAASIITGSPQFMLLGGAFEAGGQAMEKGIKQKADPWKNFAYGGMDAVAEYVTELIPVGKLLKDLKAGAPFWKVLGSQILREVPTELAATAWQNADEWLFLHPEKTLDDYMKELGPAEAQTVIATITQTLMSVGLAHGVNRLATRGIRAQEARAQQAEDVVSKVQVMADAIEQGKSRERDSESFYQFMQQMSDESGVQGFYINGKALGAALQQFGITTEELSLKMPETAKQVDEAIATDGDVLIPLAEFATSMAGSEIQQAVLPELKATADGMTFNEGQAFYQTQAEEMKKAAEELIATIATTEEKKAQVEEVRVQIEKALADTQRYSPEVAGIYASIPTAYYVNEAERLGITPAELFAALPYVVENGPLRGGLQQPVYHGTPHQW